MSNNPDGFAAAQYRPGSRRDHPAVVLEHSFRRPKLVGRQRWSQQSRLDALAKSSIKEGFRALLAQEVRFATDSPLEGTGFEPSVPPPNIRHSDVPHRFSNGSDSDWPPGRKAALSAPVARLARIKTTGRSAWSHAGVSAYAFAVFTRRIARLRVSGARATVWGSRTRRSRERSVCKLRPVWSCVARHSNKTRALRLPGPRHPS